MIIAQMKSQSGGETAGGLLRSGTQLLKVNVVYVNDDFFSINCHVAGVVSGGEHLEMGGRGAASFTVANNSVYAIVIEHTQLVCAF